MNLFLDTSVLVKLFQAENGTKAVIDWVNNARKIILLDLARLEFQSALQRLLRNQDLRRDDYNLLQQGFRERWDSFSIQPLNRKVIDEAEQLLENYGSRYGLRSLDALHAAAFILVAERNWYFAASDKNLCAVVSDLGFQVLNPLEK